MDLVPIARILKARGVKGEVWLASYREELPPLDSGDIVYVGSRESVLPMRVEHLFEYSKGLVLKLEGMGDPDQARGIRDQEVWLPEDRVPEDPEGTFDTGEILGFSVVDAARGRIGTVSDTAEWAAYWVLMVDGDRGEFTVPMVKGYRLEIDSEQRRITVDLPSPWPGLDEESGTPPAKEDPAG
jgi:16S rRNA processing protein RimM